MSKPPKPEDLLDPEAFPDDLKWVPAHYRLHPSDPVYLLIAWHWRRMKESEDTLKSAVVELRAAVDARLAALAEAAETVGGVNDALVELQSMLTEKPADLTQQIDAALTEPLAKALGRLAALERSLQSAARSFQVSQRRQLLASLLIGVALGVLLAIIVLLA